MNRTIVRVSILTLSFVSLCYQYSFSKIYRVIPLDPAGGDYCIPEGINIKGQIVGDIVFNNGASTHPFVWENGTTTDLGTLGGNDGAAWDINDLGSIVGDAADINGVDHAFLTTNAGGLIPLDQMSYAGSINNNGDIAGTSLDGHYPAILLGGNLTTLPFTGAAYGINDSGWAVGEMNVALTVPPYSVGHCFLYRGGQVIDLGLLSPGYDAWGHDINDSGLIVGVGKVLGYQHACEWRNGVIKDLYKTGGPANSYCYKVNNKGDIVGGAYPNGGARYYPFYVMNGGTGTITLKDSGWQLLEFNGINDSGQIVGGALYGGVKQGILLDPLKIKLKLVDVQGTPIRNDSITVSRVAKIAAAHQTIPVGIFVSDDSGTIVIPTDSFAVGDWIKTELKVATKPFYKHTSVLGTRNTVYLDNERIDSLGVTWDTVSGDTQQTVLMDHQTITFNCVVSIEWDADDAYLASTEEGFRRMSNYLYDVSNGQMRLDTVMIFSNGEHFYEADYQVYASNMVHPHASWPDDFKRGYGHIYLPRKWFGNSDASRNFSYSENPLDLAQPIDYRTRCHEFGHYALGFFDEYQFSDWTTSHIFGGDTVRCSDASAANYGFMDCQYVGCEPYSQEMSSSKRYSDVACRNNYQWRFDGKSCWDFTKDRYNLYDARQGVFLPLRTPEDMALPSGLDYFPGPNDYMLSGFLNYDVGSQVQFPISNSAPSGRTVTAHVSVSGMGNVRNADVTLSRGLLSRTEMDEGNTNDDGYLRVLGYESGDQLLASGYFVETVAAAKGTRLSSSRTWTSGSGTVSSGDSIQLEILPISGSFPLICEANLDSAACLLTIVGDSLFPKAPLLTIVPFGGTVDSQSLEAVSGGYSASIPNILGEQGTLRVNAVDDSGKSFFFGIAYNITQFDSVSSFYRCVGPDGSSELMLDTTNSGVKRILLLSTSYPAPANGLVTYAASAGPTVSVASFPASEFHGGNLKMSYELSALAGMTNDEIQTSLKLFHWNEAAAKWMLVGGNVDTSLLTIDGVITQGGVYAAFTVANPTGINDDQPGSLLPKQFELGQNYPNPFNPSTTISFALPGKAHVVLDIYNVLGQKIRRLLDESRPAGTHSVIWDGRDMSGQAVASGVYFYRITTEKFSASKKMLLLK